MTLKEFDWRMDVVSEWQRQATVFEKHAQQLEDRTLADAGIEHHNREPGFPCWLYKEQYYNTPREALEKNQ